MKQSKDIVKVILESQYDPDYEKKHGKVIPMEEREFHCELCQDVGYTVYNRGQEDEYVVTCSCVEKRKNILESKAKLQEAGLEEMPKKYTFNNYVRKHLFQQFAYQQAVKYVSDPKGWFVMLGQSGGGKTHLMTAMAKAFIDQGKKVRYVVWTDVMKEIKTDYLESRAKWAKIMKSVDVLYLDDFLNARARKDYDPKNKEWIEYYEPISDTEYEFAFEIINSRYNQPHLITMISTERTINDIYDIGENIGGRIEEMASKMDGKTLIHIEKKKEFNFRRANNMEELKK